MKDKRAANNMHYSRTFMYASRIQEKCVHYTL